MAKSQEQLAELLSAYIDGEVTPREKAEVEEVLRRDPGARLLHDELRNASAMIAGLPRHAAPPDLAANLDAQLERVQLLSGISEVRGANVVHTSARFTWLKAAAMLVIVVGAAWWFLSLQQLRDGRVASNEASQIQPKAMDSTSISAKPSPPQSVESLLASGASPATLLTQSFDYEPVRVQVLANSEGDREEIKKKLSNQLALANAENLTTRAKSLAEKKVGAFYIEGKPGLNFADPNERQILVRLPASKAHEIVDTITAGGKVHGDQIALLVGPATVKGPEKARVMLQMMADQDEGREMAATPDARFTETSGAGKPTGLFKTLADIVGVTPVTLEGARAARVEADAIAKPMGSATDTALTDGTEKKEANVDPTEPLVLRRFEAARARKIEEESVPANAPAEVTKTAPAPRIEVSAMAPHDPYITIVIELAVPEPKPPARNNAGRTRS